MPWVYGHWIVVCFSWPQLATCSIPLIISLESLSHSSKSFFSILTSGTLSRWPYHLLYQQKWGQKCDLLLPLNLGSYLYPQPFLLFFHVRKSGAPYTYFRPFSPPVPLILEQPIVKWLKAQAFGICRTDFRLNPDSDTYCKWINFCKPQLSLKWGQSNLPYQVFLI